MENDSYKEYFSKKSNKVSLALWALINNNPVSRNLYLLFLAIDFVEILLLILCIYSQAGSVPEISQSIVEALDFNYPEYVAIVSFAVCCKLVMSLSFILILVLKEYSWQTYSEKKILFQWQSFVVVLFRGPLLMPVILFLLHSFMSFSLVDNNYLKYISIITSIISTIILAMYSYMGSYLFNLNIPNETLPWSDTSHQPSLLSALFKLLLVLTFKLRQQSIVLLYCMALMATLVCCYRLYILLMKSHMFNETVYRAVVLLEFGVVHLMVFFLITAISQGHDYYLLFVVAFMPVTCGTGFYMKERCKRRWLNQLMNENMRSESEQRLCFLYLMYLYTEETEDSWQQLVKLQQLHYTKCEPFFSSIERKMIIKAQQDCPNSFPQQTMLTTNRNNTDRDGGPLYHYDTQQNLEGVGGLAHMASEKSVQDYSHIRGTSQYQAQEESAIDLQFQSQMNSNVFIRQGFANKLSNHSPKFTGNNKLHEDDLMLYDNEEDKFQDIDMGSRVKESPQNLNIHHSQYPETQNQLINHQARSQNVRGLSGTGDFGQKSPRAQENDPRSTIAVQKPRANSFKKANGQKHQPKLKNMSQGAKSYKSNKNGTGATTNANISEIFSNSEKPKSNQSGGFGQNNQRSTIKNQFGSASNSDRYDGDNRKEELRKLVRHYFNMHMIDDSEMSFQLKLVKIYFTFKILKNPFLAHFLLYSYQEDEDSFDSGGNFITTNQRLINQRYIDELISQRSSPQGEENGKSLFGNMNLQRLLKVNQLLVEFDSVLEGVTDSIQDFWENLISQRETIKIFTYGLKISDKLKNLQNLFNDIQENQSDSESKIYIQMAQFYSQVVFKSYESYQMLEKARVAYSVKKMQRMNLDRQGENGPSGPSGQTETQEKCLIMAGISIKKQMKVSFINKQALKVLQYTMNEALLLSINNLMPKAISDMHQTFIDAFMLTGRTNLLRNKRELFMKQKSGSVIPVHMYLFVNNMSRKHMILMFEPNTTLTVFEEPYQKHPFSFLLATREYKLCELSTNFDKITGVSHGAIGYLKEELDRQLNCDDFIKQHTHPDFEISQIMENYEVTAGEVEVTFKNVKQKYYQSFDSYITDSQIFPSSVIYTNPNIGSPAGQNNVIIYNSNAKSKQSQASNEQQQIEIRVEQPVDDNKEGSGSRQNVQNLFKKYEFLPDPVFVMKIIELKFLEGRLGMLVIAFRRKYGSFLTSTGEIITPSQISQSMMLKNGPNQTNEEYSGKRNSFNGDHNPNNTLAGINDLQKGNGRGYIAETSSVHGGMVPQHEGSSDGENDYMDVMSASSTSSQHNTTSSSAVFSSYTQHVNSKSTPKTLKFILNMVLVIILLMLAASSVILSISLQNIDKINSNIIVWENSYHVTDRMTTIRLLTRSLINIFQGYQYNSEHYLDDRETFYEQLILNVNEEMRVDSNQISLMYEKSGGSVQCGLLSLSNQVVLSNQTLSQGMNLLVGKINDGLMAEDRVQVIGKSKLPFLSINFNQSSKAETTTKIVTTQQTEREYFFILNNTKGDLYQSMKDFRDKHTNNAMQEVEDSVSYLSAVSLVVMALIILSGVLVIPFFGKIQSRIVELMKLFFTIDIKMKRSILLKINGFQNNYFKQQEKFVKRGRSAYSDHQDSQEEEQSENNDSKKDMKIKGAKGSIYSNKEISLKGQEVKSKFSTRGLVVQNSGKFKKNQHQKEVAENDSTTPIKKDNSQLNKLSSAFGMKSKHLKNVSQQKVSPPISSWNKGKKQFDATSPKAGMKKKKQDLDMIYEEEKSEEDMPTYNKSKGGKKKDKYKDLSGINLQFDRQVSSSQPEGHHYYNNDEEGSSSDDEEGDGSKRHHKKRKTDEQEGGESNSQMSAADAHQKQQMETRQREVIQEFSKYTNKRKLIQAVFVFLMLTMMASYFLLEYFLTLKLHSNMVESLSDLDILFSRQTCTQNVLSNYMEGYYDTDMTNSPFFQNTDKNIERCMSIESEYQKAIISDVNTYMSSTVDEVMSIEQGAMCNETQATSDFDINNYFNLTRDRITKDQCLELSEQIRKQGLTTYQFNIMKTVQQMQVDLQSSLRIQQANSKNSTENTEATKKLILSQLNSKIAIYIDTLMLIVMPSQMLLQANTVISMKGYFNDQGTILEIIFAVYLSATIILCVFFLLNMYKKIRREMLASNRLLYIIDFETLPEVERNGILKFLVNY